MKHDAFRSTELQNRLIHMPLLSSSTWVVNQLHGTGHKDTSELVTWLVTRKVWGIKSTVITAWSCECVRLTEKETKRQEDTGAEGTWDGSGCLCCVYLGLRKKWALFILLHKGESGTLLCFFHGRCGTQPGLCSPGYRYHNPEHHLKRLQSTLFFIHALFFHSCCQKV